ncbi:MAG: Sir2 family NAD-dependent protein deacetylase [Limnochordaceae bacterium]|nr:Sir2 family NAD-dependent protein deacetylase [Limnochordaceae bacterium]
MEALDYRGFERDVTALVDALVQASHCVVLTGAGASTDSGIPDFRSPGTGLWERLDPMETMSVHAFWQDPGRFYRLASETWLPPLLGARPNTVHYVLAGLEAAGLVKAVITQNIDGLHQKAGSRRVLEVHGHVRSARCTRCGRHYDLTALVQRLRQAGIGPYCTCGGPIKPGIVLFGDPMPPAFEDAVSEAARADLMVVVGSSLTVDPANSLPALAQQVIVNNLQPTWVDGRAVLRLPYPASQVWRAVADRLRALSIL